MPASPAPLSAAAGPRPELAPADVVAIVLAALRRNDLPFPDTGVAVAYRFASPESRAACGPLPRFLRMLHSPLYRPLLGFTRAEVGAMREVEDLAQVRVAVVPAGAAEGDAPLPYRFTLTRSLDGPLAGCWLADGVVPEEGEEGPLPAVLGAKAL